MLEKIIIDIVQNYKFTDIKSFVGDTEKRDYFLFFLFCRLADLSTGDIKFQLDKLYHETDIATFIHQLERISEQVSPTSAIKKSVDEILNNEFKLSRKALPQGVFSSLSEAEQNHFDRKLVLKLADITRTVDDPLLIKLLPEIKQALVEDNLAIITEIFSIESLNNVDLLTTYDAVEVYSRVLLRLQAVSDPLQFETGFNYQEIPSDFIDLIMEVGDISSIDSIYAPYEVTTEQSLYLALEYPDKEIQIETVTETPRHTYRKFALAQATNIKTSHTYCLSNNQIATERYDMSMCLLQPKIVTDRKTGKIAEQEERANVTYKEHLYISHMLEMLNKSGKAYVVMGKGPLFRKGDIKARQQLIEDNVVDAVITLPAKIMNFCPLPMILLVLNKAKKTDDVLFINATEFQKEESGRTVLDDIERLAEEYRSRPAQTPFSFTVSNEEIAASKYSFNGLNYVSTGEAEQYNLAELTVARKQIMNALVDKQENINKLLDS